MFATLDPLELISEEEIQNRHTEISFPQPLDETHVYDLGIREVLFDEEPPYGYHEYDELRIENDNIIMSRKPIAITQDTIARRRLVEEENGIVVDGVGINTDRIRRNGIFEHAFIATIKPNHTTYWKATNHDTVLLDAESIKAIAIAINNHVAACFAREQELYGLLTQGTLTTEQLQDFWESNND